MPGEQAAEAAGAAGDEDGALGVERDGGRSRWSVDPGQLRRVHRPSAQGEFGRTGRDGGRQDRGRGVVTVGVGQHEPAGVLDGGGPHHAPDDGLGRVRRRVGGDGDRGPGDDDQRGAVRRFGQVFLERGEDAHGGPAGPGRQVAVRGVVQGHGQGAGLGRRPVGGHLRRGPAQREQVAGGGRGGVQLLGRHLADAQ